MAPSLVAAISLCAVAAAFRDARPCGRPRAVIRRAGDDPVPLPIWAARDRLRDELEALNEEAAARHAAGDGRVGMMRLEAEVGGIESPLDWLRAQRPPLRSVARALQLEWSGSEVTATAAGFDEVHELCELDQLAAAARALPPGAQYYGGMGGGGMARFVLPRLELKRCQGRTVLACHIRWAAHEAGAAADGWEAAREAAARALEELITSEALPQSVLPAPVSSPAERAGPVEVDPRQCGGSSDAASTSVELMFDVPVSSLDIAAALAREQMHAVPRGAGMLVALDDASGGFAAVTTRGNATLSSISDLARQPLVIGTVRPPLTPESGAVNAEQGLAAPGCRLVSCESAVTVSGAGRACSLSAASDIALAPSLRAFSRGDVPTPLENAENINALWGALIAEELARCGVEWFIVCPVSGWLRARALAIKARTYDAARCRARDRHPSRSPSSATPPAHEVCGSFMMSALPRSPHLGARVRRAGQRR